MSPILEETARVDTLPEHLLSLQKKIQDKNYIKSAIERIALVLSRNIVENSQIENSRTSFR